MTPVVAICCLTSERWVALYVCSLCYVLSLIRADLKARSHPLIACALFDLTLYLSLVVLPFSPSCMCVIHAGCNWGCKQISGPGLCNVTSHGEPPFYTSSGTHSIPTLCRLFPQSLRIIASPWKLTSITSILLSHCP